MKSDLEKLSKHAKALVCTSADDCKISLDHDTKPESLPVVREALAYCLKHPNQNTTKILVLGRAIGRLEKEGAGSERTCVHCGCTDSNACKGGCGWVIKHRCTNTGVCSNCMPYEVGLVDSL